MKNSRNSQLKLKLIQYPVYNLYKTTLFFNLSYVSTISKFVIYKIKGFFYPTSSNSAPKMFLNTAQQP